VSRCIIAFSSSSSRAGNIFKESFPAPSWIMSRTSCSIPGETQSVFALWKCAKNLHQEKVFGTVMRRRDDVRKISSTVASVAENTTSIRSIKVIRITTILKGGCVCVNMKRFIPSLEALRWAHENEFPMSLINLVRCGAWNLDEYWSKGAMQSSCREGAAR